jgi:hypothetical protein
MHYLALIWEFLSLQETCLDSFTMCLVVKIGLGSQKPKKNILKLFWGSLAVPGVAWRPLGRSGIPTKLLIALYSTDTSS